MPENETDEVVFTQPTTDVERREVAGQCCERLSLTLPCVVDTMDNSVDTAYAAWPERLFVIGADGLIRYAGGQGPWGYKPKELETWLNNNIHY